MPDDEKALARLWMIAQSYTDGNVRLTINRYTNLGSISPGAVADGYLGASSGYDGFNYYFGMGKSATTVTVPDVILPKGTGLVIKGTVLDVSPGQPGTPCVSAESMTTQMEYLHLQRPIDGLNHNITMTGVPVFLTLIDSNCNSIDIGTVTSDAYYDTFSKSWTPSNEGDYKIIASFIGDDSYGSSSAATGITIGSAPTATANTGPIQTSPDYSMTIIATGIGIALIVVIAGIAIISVLRKR